MATPEIVIGAALLSMFLTYGLELGFTTLFIAHVMFSISFVVVVVRSRLIGFDRSLEEAAADLGAPPLTTFRTVTLPLLAPGIVAARAARLRPLDRRLRDLELQLGHDRDVPALHLRRQPARHPGAGQRAARRCCSPSPCVAIALVLVAAAPGEDGRGAARAGAAGRAAADEQGGSRLMAVDKGARWPRSGARGSRATRSGSSTRWSIGLASTAPAYSLAAVIGLVVLDAGVQAPAVLLASFVPMFFIAAAFYYMNRADQDCGTTFSWVTRAMGPYMGWMGGWAITMTGVLVVGSLADVAARYTFLLLGLDGLAEEKWAVIAFAVALIAIMTWRLRDRHRDLGAAAAGADLRPGDRPAAVRRRGAGQGARRRRRRGLDRPVAVVAQPVRGIEPVACWSPAC